MKMDARTIKAQVACFRHSFCFEPAEIYDAALIGMKDGRAVYSYEQLVQILMDTEGMRQAQAEYWVDMEQAAGDGNRPTGSPMIYRERDWEDLTNE